MSTVRSKSHGLRPQFDASGFTLLEILLATSLAVVLLLGLWSLFSTYTNLFETGQVKTEQSQLARALLEQVTDDLKSAIQDPIPGAPAKSRTSTPLRRFGLFGSTNELRLDVIQLTPLQGNPTPVGDSEQLLRQPSAPRVPELRTVYYTFQGPSFSPDANPEDPPGLIRREVDFETPYASDPDSGLDSQSAGDPSSPERFTPDPVDDSVIWVPEVVGLEFRYFDGNGWTGNWNSLARKSLPVAVEVAVRLGTVGEPERPGGAEGTEIGDELNTELAPQPEGPVYRLVVDLPGSPKHPAPQRVRPIAVRPPPRPVTRRIAPRRLPTTTTAVRTLPDEWMRRQP